MTISIVHQYYQCALDWGIANDHDLYYFVHTFLNFSTPFIKELLRLQEKLAASKSHIIRGSLEVTERVAFLSSARQVGSYPGN